jgi:hypothetical protein
VLFLLIPSANFYLHAGFEIGHSANSLQMPVASMPGGTLFIEKVSTYRTPTVVPIEASRAFAAGATKRILT